MSVTVCLPLFGDPGRELERKARSQDLRALGADLRARLLRAADLLDKLNQAGWSAEVAMFDLILSHPCVDTREKADARLRDLGIDPEQLLIVEDPEDEEEG